MVSLREGRGISWIAAQGKKSRRPRVVILGTKAFVAQIIGENGLTRILDDLSREIPVIPGAKMWSVSMPRVIRVPRPRKPRPPVAAIDPRTPSGRRLPY